MKTTEELKAEALMASADLTLENPGKPPIPTRQLCKRCMKYSGLGFYTPAKTWEDVTDDRYQHLCLPCFVDMADERLIDWEPGLIIHGESMAHLRERQERVAMGEYTDEGLTEWKFNVEVGDARIQELTLDKERLKDMLGKVRDVIDREIRVVPSWEARKQLLLEIDSLLSQSTDKP